MAIQTFLIVVLGSVLIGFASAANKSCECKPAITFGKNYSESAKAQEFFGTFSFAIDQANSFIQILGKEKNLTASENQTIQEVKEGLEEFVHIEGEEITSENELNALVEKIEKDLTELLPQMKNLTKDHLDEEEVLENDYLIAVLTYYNAKVGDMAECYCSKKKKAKK